MHTTSAMSGSNISIACELLPVGPGGGKLPEKLVQPGPRHVGERKVGTVGDGGVERVGSTRPGGEKAIYAVAVRS